jgi:hypothetical protein
MTEQQQPDAPDHLSPRAGSVSGALVDLALGRLGGAVTGPAAEPVADQLVRAGLGLYHRRGALACETAIRKVGWPPDELLRRIVSDQRLLDLAVTVVTAASKTALEVKIRALGRALAAGALSSDDGVLEEQQLLVNLLAFLEAPHIRLLAKAAEEPYSAREVRRGGRRHDLGGWSYATFDDLFPAAGMARPILSMLESLGLITDLSLGATARGTKYDRDISGPRYLATYAGNRLLGILREAGLDMIAGEDEHG